MAKFIESWSYEGLEGKSHAEVKARVLEFKEAFLAKGAPEVTVRENLMSDGDQSFSLDVVFPNAAAWGAFQDSFDGDTAFDAKIAAWQANPKLMGKISSLAFEVK